MSIAAALVRDARIAELDRLRCERPLTRAESVELDRLETGRDLHGRRFHEQVERARAKAVELERYGQGVGLLPREQAR